MPKWVIWSEEHGRWWRPGEHGYTDQLREAGRYTEARAKELERNANRYVKPPKSRPAVFTKRSKSSCSSPTKPAISETRSKQPMNAPDNIRLDSYRRAMRIALSRMRFERDYQTDPEFQAAIQNDIDSVLGELASVGETERHMRDA